MFGTKGLRASYKMSGLVAKASKVHRIAEIHIKPAKLVGVKEMFSEEIAAVLQQNSFVQRHCQKKTGGYRRKSRRTTGGQV